MLLIHSLINLLGTAPDKGWLEVAGYEAARGWEVGESPGWGDWRVGVVPIAPFRGSVCFRFILAASAASYYPVAPSGAALCADSVAHSQGRLECQTTWHGFSFDE